MIKKLKKTPLFYQYLLSYIAIFLIPFIFTSTFFYHLSVANLQKEIIQSHIEKIEQVSAFSDSRMKEMENIASRIVRDPELTPYMMNQPFTSKQGIRKLISYQVNSSASHDLILSYDANNFLYSTRGTGSINNFTSNMYSILDPDQQRIERDLQGVRERTIYPVKLNSSGDNQLIAYLFPIAQNGSAPYGTIAFLINEKSLLKTVQHVLAEFSGSFFIFNEHHELLTSHSSDDEISHQLFGSDVIGVSGVREAEIDGVEYSLITVKSDQTNWSFVTTISSDQLYQGMSNFKQLIFIILSIILLIGIGLSVYLSKKHYRQIQGILHVIRSNRDYQKNTNNLSGIHESIEEIFKDNEVLQSRVKLQQPYVREQLLLKLLKGYQIDEAELNQLAKDLNLSIDNRFFAVKLTFHPSFLENESLFRREKLITIDAHCSSDGVIPCC